MPLASVAKLDTSQFRDADSALRYLQQRYRMARAVSKMAPPKGTMAGNVVALYETIIEPCIRDSSPYALERPGDFRGPIRTFFVADVVGEEAPVTTIYDAIALVITLSEPNVHAHAGDHHYYKKLVGLYTCICVLIQTRLTSGPRHLIPIAAIVVYGNVGPNAKRLPLFYGNHACSLSTSLPSFLTKPYLRLKVSALEVRRDFMRQGIPRYARYLGRIHQAVKHDVDSVEDWAPGNCAETIPMARRSKEGSDMLLGVCVYMNQLQLAMQGQPKGPKVCVHCSLMMHCFSCPYADMVHSIVHPQPVAATKLRLMGVESIQTPTWNSDVSQDAAWKQLILREISSTSNPSPLYAPSFESFDTLSRVPMPPHLQVLLCFSVEQQRLWIRYWISQHTPCGAEARDSDAGYVMSIDPPDTALDLAHLGNTRRRRLSHPP